MREHEEAQELPTEPQGLRAAEGERGAQLRAALDALFVDDALSIHFQPIVDAVRPAVLGFEALCRGPSDSPLHSPLVMFEVAARYGRMVELERRVVRVILRRFFELGLPGAVFINVSADTLSAAADRIELLREEFATLAIAPGRIVIELTETRPSLDLAALHQSILAIRSLGFRIALDDLGEGFASLKRWLDVRPDFVKIDRHFVDGVAGDPVKQQLIRSMLDLARSGGARVIAEGIEQEPDLRVLLRLGVQLCQGYLFARPHPAPRPDLQLQVEHRLLEMSGTRASAEPGISAGRLARIAASVSPDCTCAHVLDLFAADEGLRSLAVVDADRRPVGVLRLLTVLKRAGGRFFRELHGRKSCSLLMDARPLIFDEQTPLAEMGESLSRIDDHHMVDGFLVTRAGRYLGSGRISDLLKAMADAREGQGSELHPLSRLPLNAAARGRIQQALDARARFTAVYWDINDLKPFNEVYGFGAGDALILMLSGLLKGISEPLGGFLAHVGGDDFVLLLDGGDWHGAVSAALESFDAGLASHLRPEHLRARGYAGSNRRSESVWHALPSLAAGVLPVEPGQFAHAHEVTAVLMELKAEAQRRGGSAWFCERRLRAPPGSR
jgi:EAL domain-containing protein (putative c-di-GMP-specific phosphodiesterase class I)/GGDEF domain-containing protein